MAASRIFPPSICEVCVAAFTRRPDEAAGDFAKRKTCSAECRYILTAMTNRRRYTPDGSYRTCRACGIEKDLDEFPLYEGNKRRRKCKYCLDALSKEWYYANRARVKATRRARYERQRDQEKARREQKRDHYRVLVSVWVQQNRERYQELLRSWRERNPDRAREQMQRRRARKKNAPRVERISRHVITDRDGNTCYLCARVLDEGEIALDHVIPLIRGGSHTMDNLRVCCHDCNGRKGRLTVEEYLHRIETSAIAPRLL
ncbi:MAG: HNH endonuclease [Dehalococcoidia bacterium]